MSEGGSAEELTLAGDARLDAATEASEVSEAARDFGAAERDAGAGSAAFEFGETACNTRPWNPVARGLRSALAVDDMLLVVLVPSKVFKV